MKLQEIKRNKEIASAKTTLEMMKWRVSEQNAIRQREASELGNKLKALDLATKAGYPLPSDAFKGLGIDLPQGEPQDMGELSLPYSDDVSDPAAGLRELVKPEMRDRTTIGPVNRLSDESGDRWVARLLQKTNPVPLEMQKAKLTAGSAMDRQVLANEGRVKAAQTSADAAMGRTRETIDAADRRESLRRKTSFDLTDIRERGNDRRTGVRETGADRRAGAAQDKAAAKKPTPLSQAAKAFDAGSSQVFTQHLQAVNQSEDPVMANVDKNGSMIIDRFKSAADKREYQKLISKAKDWTKIRDAWLKSGRMTRVTKAPKGAENITFDLNEEEE